MLDKEVGYARREVNGVAPFHLTSGVPRGHRNVVRFCECGDAPGATDPEDRDIRPHHVDQSFAQQSLKYAGIIDAVAEPQGVTVSLATFRTASMLA